MTTANHHETCGICHTDGPCEHAVEKLCNLLDEAGAKVSLDRGRNITHPCTFCGKTPEDGLTYELLTIGHYLDGNALTRPVCQRCYPIAQVRMTVKLVPRKPPEHLMRLLRGVIAPCNRCGDSLEKCAVSQCCMGCNHWNGASK